MPNQPTVQAVKFDSIKHNRPKNFALSWQGLSALLQISVPNADKTQRELWSPVIYYPDTTRGNRNVQFVTCLVVDMDGEAFDHARLDGLEYLAYTTWSHTPDDQHWHLVLPLAHPVPAELWYDVWTSLHEKINVVGDPQTKDPARIFYRPQHKPLTTPDIKIGCGSFLDPDVSPDFRATRQTFINPKSDGPRRKPAKFYWQSEAWWNEDIDMSEFDGLSKQQILLKMADELREIRKSLGYY